jgi:polysaccharide export outer membrane protein
MTAWADPSAENAAAPPGNGLAIAPGATIPAATAVSPEYILRPGDVVQVKVYQEEDLASLSRIGRDGNISLPLVGAVNVVSNTVERATAAIRELLAKDYLVNPQVTLTVVEFAKRRFTVLGQVQHSGTFDMPADDSVSLLQAIATAGGYTRIGNPSKITVQRTTGTESKVFKLDAEAMARNKSEKNFDVLPDDVIVVGEKWL